MRTQSFYDRHFKSLLAAHTLAVITVLTALLVAMGAQAGAYL